MPNYRYYSEPEDTPESKAAGGFATGISNAIDLIMQKKMEDKIKRKQVQDELAMKGYVEKAPQTAGDLGSILRKPEEEYEDKVTYEGKEYVKPLSSWEKEERAAKRAKWERDAKEPAFTLEDLVGAKGGNVPLGDMEKSYTVDSKGNVSVKFTPKQQTLAEKEATKSAAKAESKAKEMDIKFQKVENLMSNVVGQFKASLQETGGGGLLGWRGIGGKIAGETGKMKEFAMTSAYQGQLTETAAALNSIITGQNRIIESMVERIIKTLPQSGDSGTHMVNKVRQSLRNSYGLMKAMRGQGMTTEYLESLPDDQFQNPDSELNQTINSLNPQPLTVEEEAKIDGIVERVLKTPASPKIEATPLGEIEESGGQIPVGTIEDGYEYMGGDPADPASWKEIR